jgi:hypothetical protein
LYFLPVGAFAELADAALDGGLDGGQDGRHRGVDVLVALHRREEGAVVQVFGDAEVGEGVDVGGLEPVVPRVQVRAALPAQVPLQGSDVVAEFLGVGDGVRLVPGRPGRAGAVRGERRGRRGSTSTWDRSTSQEPGIFGLKVGVWKWPGAERPTTRRAAAARKAAFRSRPTAYGSVHSSSVSRLTSRTHWYASSLRKPPFQPLSTTGCSGVASGGAGSIGSVPREPGLWPGTQLPVAGSCVARVGGRSAGKRCGQKFTDQRWEETTAHRTAWNAGDVSVCGTCHADDVAREEAAAEAAHLHAAAPPESETDRDQEPGKPRRGLLRWRT